MFRRLLTFGLGGRERHDPGAAADPFRLLQLVAGGLLLAATAVALLLWATGLVPRALTLAAVLWVVYGVAGVLWTSVIGPFPDAVARALQDVGLRRTVGFSEIETLVARGHLTLAADRYAARAREPGSRVEATVRRARLLAGPLHAPQLAIAELEALRATPLDPPDDRLVRRTLSELRAAPSAPGATPPASNP